MVQQDTIRLMRECGSGIKMGISAIDEVYDSVCSDGFKNILCKSRNTHAKLGEELRLLLNEYGEEDREPSPIVKGMSWLRTNAALAVNESDRAIADLLTDGCGMGIKNLSRYLNKYSAADQRSRDITKKLCDCEQELLVDMRSFL